MWDCAGKEKSEQEFDQKKSFEGTREEGICKRRKKFFENWDHLTLTEIKGKPKSKWGQFRF